MPNTKLTIKIVKDIFDFAKAAKLHQIWIHLLNMKKSPEIPIEKLYSICSMISGADVINRIQHGSIATLL